MAATSNLKAEALVPENVDEKSVLDGQLVAEDGDEARTLTVLQTLPDPEAREWLGRVKRVVEEALTRQSRRLAERETVIREQSEAIARYEVERRHDHQMHDKELELKQETQRRLKATNRNLRTALEERDRRLVVFARKLSKVRQDKDGRGVARTQIIEQLKELKWYQRSERKALLEALTSLG